MKGSSESPRRTRPSPWAQYNSSKGNSDAEPREAAKQRTECELAFHAAQRGTEAEVGGVSEGEVMHLGATEVEQLRLRVSLSIPIGGREADDDLSSGGDGHSADLYRLARVAESRLRDRCVVAEELRERG